MYKCAEDTEEELEVELVEDLKSREPLREEVELAIKKLSGLLSHHRRDDQSKWITGD